ncbi:Heterokaryon incompatibility protein S [Pleurostoma richardsiae]|uniref:Heterokaryon incompatibility protein S n=1 Tax=Pleurostoma richardsiae TaxID=41990 RepID=A0AA38VG19_9PEZI|nr:Heterokaryon incompatibility protein S [Pleurostoma richardsiae]
MAEVFGTIVSALSVAALFNNCINCFEYVQLGRHFGQDFERGRLRLDIAQTRLSRWGQAVAINEDSQFATASPVDASLLQVRLILEELELLFQSARKTSRRYELGAKQQDLALFRDSDMRPMFRRLHGHLVSVVRQRQKQTSLTKKMAWALYEGRHFDKLVQQITGFLDDLEKIYPVEAARRHLAQEEIEGIGDEPSLAVVSEAAANVDSVLTIAVAERAGAIAVKNYARVIGTRGKARVQVGNEFVENVLACRVSISDQTENTADTVDAEGESAVHIGNTYGGQGNLARHDTGTRGGHSTETDTAPDAQTSRTNKHTRIEMLH